MKTGSQKKSGLNFDFINYFLLVIVAICMLYPIINIIAVSFSTDPGYYKNPYMVLPTEPSLSAFKFILGNVLIMNSYINTIVITASATMLGLLLTVIMAYPLSKRDLRGQKVFMYILIITMMFNGGLIPNFYLIKSLNWLDTFWALIVPGCMTAFNVILMKSFFERIPQELHDAAKIDGASEITLLVRIILPLSGAILATIALFLMVGYWNSYFNAMIYMRTQTKWTLQLVLREILLSSEFQYMTSGGDIYGLPVQTIKYSTIVVSTLPILCVYPFLQKYFVTGIMLGAAKG